MAAKGTESKEKIINELQKIFPNAFMNGKEFRIPFNENNEQIEIKVTLTCAKENIGGGQAVTAKPVSNDGFPEPVKKEVEPTPEEVENVKTLLNALGL